MSERELPVDKSSDDWRKVEAWVKGKIDYHDRQLRTLGMEHSDTEGHRYAINVLETLLKAAEPSKISSSDSESG